ncbi:MAG TPA: hypothetical protein VKH43_06080 [Thermoanaerobaculia bacterium]|nr:hypothetical protein [Thermoanaerobaculia bacterium]
MPAAVALAAAALLGAATGSFGVCGPFADVNDPTFCPYVLEILYFGITTGTTPTTYSPSDGVSRLQMAAFLSRTVDGVARRKAPRASLRQTWTTQNALALAQTSVGRTPKFLEADGMDVWVSNTGESSISRVRSANGNYLETWTGADSPGRVLVAMGRVLVPGATLPGRLYSIDPAGSAGVVTTVASNIGQPAEGITFDGGRVWTVGGGAVAIITPQAAVPWTVTTITTGFDLPVAALYDGSNVWVTDDGLNRLLKVNSAGAVLQSVTVGTLPEQPTFDGTNIWVPNFDPPSVSVVRASSGAVLATLTGSGLLGPVGSAFDGTRVLVTDFTASKVWLWKAADLTPLGSFPVGSGPQGACSDGVRFWIALPDSGKIARF